MKLRLIAAAVAAVAMAAAQAAERQFMDFTLESLR